MFKSSKKKINLIYDFVKKNLNDSTHDLAHSLRIIKNCLEISKVEGGDNDILIAAAFFHDICNFAKNHPKRKLSSEYSAQKAETFLIQINFDKQKIPTIKEAILCHSFSRNQKPQTLEGKIFQDADRLDSIGAVGICRAFMIGGSFGCNIYKSEDPFFKTNRNLDDKKYTTDHFYTKLFKLKDMMLTKTGKILAEKRHKYMITFLNRLESEIS